MELASGVDALYLSGRAALPESLLTRLADRRQVAEGTGGAIPFQLGNTEFGLAPHAFSKYRYCLDHRHGRVGLTPSRLLPAVRVQPRTEFLQGVGPRAAAEWFGDVLSPECGAIRFGVSRLDLHADFQGWSLDGDQRHRFVCRASLRDTHEDGQELTGFEFGRRTSKTITARIYDKAKESHRKGTDFWPLIWGASYRRGLPVHRVEFEFGREGLNQYGLDTPDEVLDAAGALWSDVTASWLTYRTPTSDCTRSRWPVAKEWEQVQRARIGEAASGVERVYAGRVKGSLRRLMPGLVGHLAGFAALTGCSGIADTLARLPAALHDYEISSGLAFSERIAEKLRAAAFS